MVKVVVPDGARLSATRAASRTDLQVGGTVVVRGERGGGRYDFGRQRHRQRA